jgi:hypothetical protein
LVTASDWAAIGNSATAIMIISHRRFAACSASGRRPPAATAFYRPVELSEEDTTALVKRASATAGHVLAMSIRITYLERSR